VGSTAYDAARNKRARTKRSEREKVLSITDNQKRGVEVPDLEDSAGFARAIGGL
jgi:hypothetical protein